MLGRKVGTAMKIGIRRIMVALLMLALAFGLTACGKSGDQKKAELVFRTSPYYAQEDMPTAAPVGMLLGCCTDGESIWYLHYLPEYGHFRLQQGEGGGVGLCALSAASGRQCDRMADGYRRTF